MFGRIIVRAQETTNNATLSQIAAVTLTPTRMRATASPEPAHTATSVATVAPTHAHTPVPTATALSQAPAPELPPQRFAAHFVASSPQHGAVLDRAPERMQLDFIFTLARNSNINVRKDGEKLMLEGMGFSGNRLQMMMDVPYARARLYHVPNRAGWPAKSYHDGEFAFVVR